MRYHILQINHERDPHHHVFSDKKTLIHLSETVFPPPEELYDRIYTDVTDRLDPERLFDRFNNRRPNDYQGRSLSVSDVIEYHLPNGELLHLFCDTFGFTPIDFGEQYQITTKDEYVPGTKNINEQIVLCYQNSNGKRTVTIDAEALESGRKDAADENGAVTLTAAERLRALSVLRNGRREIREKEDVRTLEGWEQSGIPNFGDYVLPGDYVDDKMVNYFLDILPPASTSAGYLQAGEALAYVPDEKGTFRSCFTTFVMEYHNKWRYCGACHLNQIKNLLPIPDLYERFMEIIRK